MSAKVGAAIAAILILGIGGLVFLNQSGQEEADLTTESADTASVPAEESAKENNLEVIDLTMEEVKQHNNQSDCWLVINGTVYDVTDFVSSHPGGDEILRGCGTDATKLFTTRTTDDGESIGSGTPHSTNASTQLEQFKIGPLAQ